MGNTNPRSLEAAIREVERRMRKFKIPPRSPGKDFARGRRAGMLVALRLMRSVTRLDDPTKEPNYFEEPACATSP
jgi:hypothetical protein